MEPRSPTAQEMTPEQDDRIRALAKLIAYENNAERLHVLAMEMEQLLAARLHEMKSKPGPEKPPK
jgi:hypothetical protein